MTRCELAQAFSLLICVTHKGTDMMQGGFTWCVVWLVLTGLLLLDS